MFGIPKYNPNPSWPYLGQGVMGFGMGKTQGPTPVSLAPPGQVVQGIMAPIEGGITEAMQMATPVPITGNGAQLAGYLALQALANLKNNPTN